MKTLFQRFNQELIKFKAYVAKSYIKAKNQEKVRLKIQNNFQDIP